jgi:hypothetical protein
MPGRRTAHSTRPRCFLPVLAAAIFVLPSTLTAETLPLPKPGLTIDYRGTLVVVGPGKRKSDGLYSVVVTCVQNGYVATDRVHRSGAHQTTSRLITYRHVTPARMTVTLSRGRVIDRRFIFPKEEIDRYFKAGGEKKVSFSVGSAPAKGRANPGKVMKSAALVSLKALRKETISVPAGRFKTVVMTSTTVSRPPTPAVDKIVVEATGWFAPKVGYPVKIYIRQAITGKHARTVDQTYLASKITQASAPANGCRDVPEK